MIDNYKVGERIALLRKERGLTGEKLAEILGVSAQAVSKWENGKNVPDTMHLPALSDILGVSIDSLLLPQELTILSAVFSDGLTHADVTQTIDKYVNGNRLSVTISPQFIGAPFDSPRVSALTVKYRTPSGAYYAFAAQNESLSLDLASEGYPENGGFEIIGAYYGNVKSFKSVMVKIKHYDYFSWDEIRVNHETFPSSPDADEPEFLTLIYLNRNGMHVISCREDETLQYTENRTVLRLKDASSCILPGVITLEWEKDMDCTWAGALYASLKYMGEPYTYEQLMGMSGACYRLGFCEVWDWSATDALVAFDYASVLFNAIGYEHIWADRVDKSSRGEERKRIVNDISRGMPVIAINLRIAPEWGVITGYSDNGKILYCRTYFDREYLDESKEYLETDNWPFLVIHFGEKKEKPSELEILKESMRVSVESFEARPNRGYFQGKQAYQKWIEGLKDNALWDSQNQKPDIGKDIGRRLGVNDSMLLNLIDARYCAARYLEENAALLGGGKAHQLSEIAARYDGIARRLQTFRNKLNSIKDAGSEPICYNTMDIRPSCELPYRLEQIAVLESALDDEAEIVRKIKELLV